MYPLWSLPFRGLAWVASGQAVQRFTANAWETYWRSREFAADQYAARLGQGPALARTLEHSSLPYERSIRNMRFSRASHPTPSPASQSSAHKHNRRPHDDRGAHNPRQRDAHEPLDGATRALCHTATDRR
jgi:hypothetical protein